MRGSTEALCQNVRCPAQDRWSPVDEKTVFCRYCGAAYLIDVRSLTKRTEELHKDLRRIHDRFAIGALSLAAVVWFLMAFYIYFSGVTSSEGVLFLILFGLCGVGFFMFSGIVVSFLVQRHKKSKFPELFKTSNWRCLGV
jgi:hypothetical protein